MSRASALSAAAGSRRARQQVLLFRPARSAGESFSTSMTSRSAASGARRASRRRGRDRAGRFPPERPRRSWRRRPGRVATGLPSSSSTATGMSDAIRPENHCRGLPLDPEAVCTWPPPTSTTRIAFGSASFSERRTAFSPSWRPRCTARRTSPSSRVAPCRRESSRLRTGLEEAQVVGAVRVDLARDVRGLLRPSDP